MGKNIKIEGFLLSFYLKEKSIWSLLSITKKAKRLINEVVINKAFGLHDIHAAMAEYKSNMGKGKVLLKPSIVMEDS